MIDPALLEQQHRQYHAPKHWWEKKTSWYERGWWTLLAILGAVLAIYVPFCWATLPADIKNESWGLSLGITVFSTAVGVRLTWLGTVLAIRAFTKREEGVSHLEGLSVTLVGVFLALGLLAYVSNEIDRGVNATIQGEMLRKMNTFERERAG